MDISESNGWTLISKSQGIELLTKEVCTYRDQRGITAHERRWAVVDEDGTVLCQESNAPCASGFYSGVLKGIALADQIPHTR